MTGQRKTLLKGQANVSSPWDPAAVEPAELTAIRALAAGVATQQQQQAFIRWLVRASGVEEMTFRPGGDDGRRASDFAEGKRFVALQFFTLAKTYVADNSRPEKENTAP